MAMIFDSFPLGLMPVIAFVFTIFFSYVAFSIAGFGTALIAAPILSNFIPLNEIVPLLALLDFVAATRRGLKFNSEVAFKEIKIMMPLLALGTAFGILILFSMDDSFALASLGLFVIAYVGYSLSTNANARKFKLWAAGPFAFIGGVFGGLFGSGGFLYALYLSRRLDKVVSVRASMGVLIAFSTAVRVTVFVLSGTYFDGNLFLLAIAALPAVFLGEYLGDKVSVMLSKQVFMFSLRIMLLISGIALLVRALAQ